MNKVVSILFATVATLSTFSTAAFAQLPNPTNGWNLGNTMETTGAVGSWDPAPTQALMNSVASAGFNTVRIPCAWDSHANQSTYKIDATYMSQVKQVIDWCIAKNQYVIINDHWDDGWLESNFTGSVNSVTNAKVKSYWTQIATTFAGYNSHLLFACANEPHADNAAKWSELMTYYQTFVNAVRSVGGNNTSRWLVIQGPSTDIDSTTSLVTNLPSDPTPGRIMFEVHYYSPYQFCGMTSDATWGNMFYFWGANYHSSTLPSRNCTWGEESYVDSEFAKMQTQFTSKGIPVLLGEYGAIRRTGSSDLTGNNVSLHLASRAYWYKYVTNSARSHGMYPVIWDDGYLGTNSFGIFDRNAGTLVDTAIATAATAGSLAIANGTYKIISRNSGLAMDAYGAGTANGTQIIQWNYGGGSNQKWTVTNTGGSNYKIIGVQSGKSLDINGFSSTNGAKVELWDYSGGSNQTFTFTATDSGYYRITPNCATSSCLDVTGGSTANGANVQLWSYTGSNNQQWSFQAP